jgi:hypothetical protein
MSLDRSLAMVVDPRPWRWATPPVLDESGAIEVEGEAEELDGVFVLVSDDVLDRLVENLPEEDAAELRDWIHAFDDEEGAEWNVPTWAGDTRSAFLRVPSSIWDDPTSRPPEKVRRFFGFLYREPLLDIERPE